MRVKLIWLVSALTILLLIWMYRASALSFVTGIAASLALGSILLKERKERVESGLSKEQFMLRKAGGASELIRQSKNIRLLAYFLTFIWLGVTLLALMIFIKAGIFVFFVLGIFLVPCIIYFLRLARRQSQIALDSQHEGDMTMPS